jgi:phosphoglycolate phosphatase
VECELAVFDMTGTLVDAHARTSSRAELRAKTLGELAGEEAVSHWAELSGVNTETWEVDADGPLARAPRREDLIVGATALYLAGFAWQEAKDLAKKAYDEADRLMPHHYRPTLFEGTMDALGALREAGVKLAIATNDRREDSEATFRVAEALHLFDAVVGADDVEEPKPSPEMVLLACQRCGLDPGAALYFGDQPTDMLAGRAAGTRGNVAVCIGSSPGPEMLELSDLVLDTYQKLEIA